LLKLTSYSFLILELSGDHSQISYLRNCKRSFWNWPVPKPITNTLPARKGYAG